MKFDRKKVEQKLQMASGLFELAYKTKKAQLKKKFPQLSETEINRKAYALIEKGCK